MPTHPISTSLVPINQVHPNPQQPRKTFEPQDQADLKASIQERGLINPISVIQRGEGDYLIIAGERRYRAICELGWNEIDARIWPGSTPVQELELLALVENLQRKDLSPIEVARGYEMLSREPHNLTQEQIASQVGVPQSTVSRILDVLAQPADIQELMPRGIISLAHLRCLNKVADVATRIKLAKQADKEGWSSRDTQKQVERKLEGSVDKTNGRTGNNTLERKSPFQLTSAGTSLRGRFVLRRTDDLDTFLAELRKEILAWNSAHPIGPGSQPAK